MSVIKLSQYPEHALPSAFIPQIEAWRQTTDVHDQFVNVEGRQNLICTLSANDKLLGFAQLHIDDECGHLKTLHISPNNRFKGLGSILMMHAMRRLQALDIAGMRLECHGKLSRFFSRFGFVILNETKQGQRCMMYQPSVSYFLNHVPKARQFDGKLSNTVMLLGSDSQSYNFTTESQYLAMHRMMLNQAQRRIWILTDNISNPVLNSEDTSQAIYRLVKKNPQAEIKILLNNDKQGAGYFNACINMAQRLSSYVEIRSTQGGGSGRMSEMITLVDHSGSIFRKHTSNHKGFGCFNNKLIYERMRSNFQNHWQFAKPSMQLRRLAI